MAKVIRMPSADEIDRSYREAITKVPEKYKRRVQQTTGWKEAAIAGEKAYREKMEAVLAEERRAKGLDKVTEDEWKKAAVEKGARVIARNMEYAAPKRKAKYEPFRSALDGLELPDKTADPMANIDNRLKPVVRALVETKKALLG